MNARWWASYSLNGGNVSEYAKLINGDIYSWGKSTLELVMPRNVWRIGMEESLLREAETVRLKAHPQKSTHAVNQSRMYIGCGGGHLHELGNMYPLFKMIPEIKSKRNK
jgi:hypothetical protein